MSTDDGYSLFVYWVMSDVWFHIFMLNTDNVYCLLDVQWISMFWCRTFNFHVYYRWFLLLAYQAILIEKSFLHWFVTKTVACLMYYGLEVLSITFSVVVGNFTNKIKLLVMEGGCLEVWKSSGGRREHGGFCFSGRTLNFE